MATQRGLIEPTPTKRSSQSSPASKIPKPILVGGLVFIIVAAGAWGVLGLRSGTPEVILEATTPGEKALGAINKAVFTDKTKMKWLSVSIGATEDKNGVMLSGQVKTRADLAELTALVNANKGSAEAKFDVTVGN